MRFAPQGGNGLRGPLAGPAGGSVTVNVGPNDYSVDISNSSGGGATSVPVTPGKDTSIPIPVVPPGTVLTVRIGRGPNARYFALEVIAPGP